MDFKLTEEQEDIRKAAREFAEGELTEELAHECDVEEKFPRELWKKACELGFIGADIPEEYGGGGLGVLENCLIAEEFCRKDMGLGLILATTFGCQFIYTGGTDEQKEKYMPGLTTGEKICGAAFTEADAGSDVAGIKTTAVEDGDEFVVNGSKMFITNGTIADWIVVYVVTKPDARKRHRKQSVLIMDTDSEGFEANKIHGKMGIRASDTAELTFKDVRVPKENLLGDSGMGFYYVMEFFNATRIAVGAQAVGVAQGALDQAVAHVRQREVFEKKLGKFQSIQFELAEMAIHVEAARNLVYKAACITDDTGQPDAMATAIAKYYAGEAAVFCCDHSLQLHGGYGYINEYPIERFYRDAKVLEIYEGSKQIEKLLIGRGTVGSIQ